MFGSAAACWARELDDEQRQHCCRRSRDRRIDYVAQEAVTLSTTPVWRDGGCSRGRSRCGCFSPRPATNGRSCRAASCALPKTPMRAPISLQRGDATADAWVLSDAPVAPVTLLPAPGRVAVQRATAHAAEPSRRQSVLGRALYRARGGDIAAGPRVCSTASPKRKTPPRRWWRASATCCRTGTPRRQDRDDDAGDGGRARC